MPERTGAPGPAQAPEAAARTDIRLLFATRITRLFAYGLLSVILALYLAALGLSTPEIGALMTLTLIGDTVISLWLTVVADRVGRRRMLLVGAGLMAVTGGLFAVSREFVVLLVAATLGVISPSGHDIGPFLSIEQAALSERVPFSRRTRAFAWYSLVGSFATAGGALAGGAIAQVLQRAGHAPLESYRVLVILYAVAGAVLFALFARLSPAVEPSAAAAGTKLRMRFGLHRSRKTVARLSGLFALDAFGGGFAIQSLVAYWFYLRFGTEPAMLGAIFFGANLLAGVSALLAARLAARIGLINTMVFTHLPSNVLLMLVPLMPSEGLAIATLLLRFSISQMDVPTRQSYVMAVVSADERSAAAGVTAVARSVGAAASPGLAGLFLASATLASIPFFLAGTLKIAYGLLLYRGFRSARPTEEAPRDGGAPASGHPQSRRE
jgi:MFS family permease